MEERFPYEFVTWHHKTPIGVKINEVFGMDSKKGKAWLELARQIYFEQGADNYRVIEHFENGAPYLEGYPGRISLTHTSSFFAVASLPKTPEVNLSEFSPRAAMGIDAEALDRKQVIKVRNKFLSEKEMDFIPETDLSLNVQAWTAKEALYKAALTPGLDFKENIIISKLPAIQHEQNFKVSSELGIAKIIFPQEERAIPQDMLIYSYQSYGCCVTIAISPKAAKFGR